MKKEANQKHEVQKLRTQPWPGATCWSWGAPKQWGDGPWTGEPDKVLWTDTATGLLCLARRGNSAAWCGYVALDTDHSLHGKEYMEVHELLPDLKVHWGLTFSGPCEDDGSENAICHQTSDADRVWWLGFDCSHYKDFGLLELKELAEEQQAFVESGHRIAQNSRFRAEMLTRAQSTYKTLKWVRLETEHLARQLKAAS